MSETLIGWTGYEWLIPRPCEVCKKPVSRGIVKVKDRGRELKEDFKTVCWPCFYDFPKAPPSEAPNE